MEEKIINVNKTYFPHVLFHFKHSLRPFIKVVDGLGRPQFVDLDSFEVKSFDEVEWEMEFYKDPTDEDFYGVAVICDFSY